MSIKGTLRAFETRFPAIEEARFSIERRVRRVLHSVHDSDWRAFSLLKIADGPIVDVGGNRGQSIESFHVVLPEKPIISFEPNPELSARLAALYAEDPNVRVEHVALGAAEGQATLFLPQYRGWQFDGLASLDRKEAEGWLNPDRLHGFDQAKLSTLEFTVRVKTLDSYELAPSIIKLDTQGTEEQVIIGSMQTIERFRPVILTEGATPATTNLLAPIGYRPYIFDGQTLLVDRSDSTNTLYLAQQPRV